MNTKKIMALTLAALMAAGTTTVAFADNATKDRQLEFVDGTIYENVDGVLTVDDGEYAPGDTLYLRLDEYTGADESDSDKKRMNVYADWKVGGDNVESIDIVYKKGAVPTGKVEFTIAGVTLTADSVGDVESVIKAAYDASTYPALNAYIDGLYATKNSGEGYVDTTSTVWSESVPAGYKEVTGNAAFKVTADNKIYENSELSTYIAATFTEDATAIFTKSGDDTKKVAQGKAADDSSEYTNEISSVDGYKTTVAGSDSVFYFAAPDASVQDFIDATLVENVSADTIIDESSREAATTVKKNDATIYVVAADNKYYTSASDAAHAVITSEAAKVSTSAEEKNAYTYWVEVKTKDNDTTKELDVAGTLYIGTSKNKAEDATAQPVSFELSNRASDYNNPAIDDETTIEPDANGAVKFADDAEEVTIYFGSNEDAWFTFNAKGQSDVNFAYTMKFNSEIADLFPKANIDFITWTATPATNRTGDLYITADEDTFLYEVTEDGIKEVNGAEYDEDEGAWHIRTRKLTAYAISDMELDTSVKLDNDSSSSTSSGSNTDADGNKTNPDTGR